MAVKITKSFVDRVAVPERGKQKIHWDSEIKGFGLRVTPERKTYVVQQRVNGRTVRHTIDLHGRITPEQARVAARQVMGDMARGVDPNRRQQEEERLAVTLQDAYEEYLRTRRLSANTLHDYERAMCVGFHEWRGRPIVGITREMILRRFEQLSVTSRAQANLRFRFLRALLNFAMERYQSPIGDPLIPSNPCNVLKVFHKWHTIPPRDRYVKEQEFARLFAALTHDPTDTQHRNDIRDFCACLVLTGCREQEIASLRWADINLQEGILRLPVTKNGDSHTLPLGSWLLRLFRRRWYKAVNSATTSLFVFPADNAQGHLMNHRKGLRAIVQASGVQFTPHDLRRTFATIASEKLGGERSYFLVARLLNHRKSDVTSRYVQVPLSSLRQAMQTIENAVVAGAPDLASPLRLAGGA